MIQNVLFILALLFGPAFFIYLGALFITWGDCWNPGLWTEETRLSVVILQVFWTFLISPIIINL